MMMIMMMMIICIMTVMMIIQTLFFLNLNYIFAFKQVFVKYYYPSSIYAFILKPTKFETIVKCNKNKVQFSIVFLRIMTLISEKCKITSMQSSSSLS